VKKILVSICAAMLLLGSFGMAGAITFYPNPVDIYDLEHSHYYTWGINWTIPAGGTILGASLSFENIRNWDGGSNTLFIHLLDTANAGVTSYWDNNTSIIYDDFTSEGTFLISYSLSTVAQDITYEFNAAQVNKLIEYLAGDNFGIGFDPDCHYWNDGISLTIITPEPMTMLLLGFGLLSLGLVRRKR
jgi:hypothetical protein